jgi:hypothetical protein
MRWFKANLWPQIKFILLMCIIGIAAGGGK